MLTGTTNRDDVWVVCMKGGGLHAKICTEALCMQGRMGLHLSNCRSTKRTNLFFIRATQAIYLSLSDWFCACKSRRFATTIWSHTREALRSKYH